MRVVMLVLAAGVALAPAVVTAQPSRRPAVHAHSPAPPGGATSTGAPEGSIPPIDPVNHWDTTDSDELIAHIQRAALGPPGPAARAIAGTLLSGVTPRVAATGLDALGALGRVEGTEAVLRFLDHRRASLRRHAVAAAAGIHSRPLVRALEARLGDGDADVRAEAAAALGDHDVGDHASLAPLWSAFDRDLNAALRPDGSQLAHNACVSIAKIGTVEDIDRLLGYLRRAPFGTMSDAFRAALERQDIPEATKLRIVQSVGDLATIEARAFLLTYANPRGHAPAPLAEAARTAAAHIGEPSP